MTGAEEYYVKFKDKDGNIRKEYIIAKNCSRAVRTAKVKYNAKSIIKSGRAVNEKEHFFGRMLEF